MEGLKTVDVSHIPPYSGIQALEATFDPRTPFIVVRFSENGENRGYGLRIDSHKRIFLPDEPFETRDREEANEKLCIPIIEACQRSMGILV